MCDLLSPLLFLFPTLFTIAKLPAWNNLYTAIGTGIEWFFVLIFFHSIVGSKSF